MGCRIAPVRSNGLRGPRNRGAKERSPPAEPSCSHSDRVSRRGGYLSRQPVPMGTQSRGPAEYPLLARGEAKGNSGIRHAFWEAVPRSQVASEPHEGGRPFPSTVHKGWLGVRRPLTPRLNSLARPGAGEILAIYVAGFSFGSRTVTSCGRADGSNAMASKCSATKSGVL